MQGGGGIYDTIKCAGGWEEEKACFLFLHSG